MTRDRENPAHIGLNDVLGNYSLTLIDSLSTLAILAGGSQQDSGSLTAAKALGDFQNGIALFVLHYGDGRAGPSGTGIRATGFDLDSKVQVFETVIRGVGGLLSAHLFAIGELPITGYDPTPLQEAVGDNPLELPPIPWPNGFKYDGQLLRLALDLGQRLLPAFYTTTGIPYPRVNLRHGIPFYVNSPLHDMPEVMRQTEDIKEITETCSAGAGSLTLEFTVLSRLSGDLRFEQAAKRAFWEVWRRRSDIGLIGNGIDAERGSWIGSHSGIGAGMDSFFEYALKSHILLSGHDAPNVSTSSRHRRTDWLDPNSIHDPLAPELQSSDAFLETWHQAHASVKRHLYTDRSSHPYYGNRHRATGQPYAMWIDSLGAFYAGLLALAGEIDEAIEANLVYTALWTRYSAIPERWSVRENNVEGGLGWWPGRPEFVESTYYIYRATKDPWYLHVGEMVLKDIRWRCFTPCGWAGLQDVRTGEKVDRMESFFLGETTKYMYLLFDSDHPLNKLDAAFVFSTEGHPLIIPHKKRQSPSPKRQNRSNDVVLYSYYDDSFTNSCPAMARDASLVGSVTAARPGLFDASRFIDLHNTPNIHGPIETIQVEDNKKGVVTTYRPLSNHTFFPWTLPPTMLPQNGTCAAPEDRVMAWIEFPASDGPLSLISRFGSSLVWHDYLGPTVRYMEGLTLQLEMAARAAGEDPAWRISQVGHTQLGRDERVFFHAEQVRHFQDESFTVTRRQDLVEIVLLLDGDERKNASTLFPADKANVMGAQSRGSIPNASATPSDSLLQSLLRAVSSVLEPSFTSAPGPSDASSGGPLVLSWEADTPVGPGAFPVPAVPDTPRAGGPHFNAKRPLVNFPFTRVFLAGDACDAPLPPAASRQHQVIVMRRGGGCSFSEKLDRVPSFSPGPLSLQLVVVVDEDALDADGNDLNLDLDDDDDDDDGGGQRAGTERRGTRPLLDADQLTPRGVRRVNGVPMVLLRAAPGDYELFGRGAAVGMRRKYRVQSQGHLVENAVVL